ncbi:hypothetical protein Peur_064664 [Populus x canadensis]
MHVDGIAIGYSLEMLAFGAGGGADMDCIPGLSVDKRFMKKFGVPVTKLQPLNPGPLFINCFLNLAELVLFQNCMPTLLTIMPREFRSCEWNLDELSVLNTGAELMMMAIPIHVPP